MIALSGISCALALISVVGSMFVEFMTLTFAVLSAVFVSMPFTQKYWVGGIISYIATSIIAFLIGNINALPFILFFGAYAIIQWGIEHKLYPLIKNKIVRFSTGYLLKIAYFECVIAIFWFLFSSLIPVLTIFGKTIKLTYLIVALAGIPVFLLYDLMMHLLFKNFAFLVEKIIKKSTRTTTPDDVMFDGSSKKNKLPDDNSADENSEDSNHSKSDFNTQEKNLDVKNDNQEKSDIDSFFDKNGTED